MAGISEKLRKEAGQAFRDYEKFIVENLLGRPTWRLDAQPLSDVLATGDAARVREFIAALGASELQLRRSVIIR